jgi:hypothetical protein
VPVGFGRYQALLQLGLHQALRRSPNELVLGAIERVHRIDNRDSSLLAELPLVEFFCKAGFTVEYKNSKPICELGRVCLMFPIC